jgi:ABC-2 type transport system permease protein
VSTSHQQSSIGGSVAVLIFAAIGGIWVPTYVMPEMMEKLSVISPLNWGLNAFYNIFLRGAGISEIIYDAGKLVIFGIAMVLLAYFYQKWKQD